MKIRSFFIVLMLCFSVFSCKNTKQSPPANILSKESVENIFIEMCLIDSEMKVLIFNHPVEELRMWMNTKLNQLFMQYHTDYSQFMESFTYYMSDTKISKQMMEDVTNRLIKLQTEKTGKVNEKINE